MVFGEFDSHTSTNNKKINNMYRQYKTNQQCWDEVTNEIIKSKEREKICLQMFGQKNLIGLTKEQRDLFWKSI